MLDTVRYRINRWLDMSIAQAEKREKGESKKESKKKMGRKT